MSVTADIRMHFTRLLDFSGREARRAFWPWVALQFGVVQVANMAGGVALVAWVTLFLFSRLLFGPIPGEAVGMDFGSLFACGFITNFLYIGTLAFLVFLLAKPSEAAENRFGKPPVQADAEADS